ncbi:MAG: hypothetical protein ACR2GU_16835 [Rubrobacteraceae bacterium]
MSDNPQDGPQERRRRGPLGDHDEEQTRRSSAEDDSGATRLIPGGQGRRRGTEEQRTRAIPEEDRQVGQTRKRSVIRPSGFEGGGRERSTGYSSGYYEAAEEREIRLQELYGGIDWLASFLGFVFAAVAGGLFSLIAALVVGRLGLSLSLGGGGLGTTAVTALVVLGILVFLTFFCGGYVAGRLARFDGGRNGVMVVVWGLVVGAISLSAGTLLPGQIFSYLQSFVQNTLLPTVDTLTSMGVLGIGLAIGALLLMLLGGFAGGRLGSHYHSEIDRTT